MRGVIAYIHYFFVLLWLGIIPAGATIPYGLDSRGPVGPFLNNTLPPAASGASGSWMTVQAFPNLTFEDPTFLTFAPRTNLLYVCGRQGTIWVFQNDPNTATKTEFLNLTNRNQGYDDCGLLGMAFHPEFGQSGSTNRGYVYVYYQYTPAPTNSAPNRPDVNTVSYNRLSRFTVPDGTFTADPNSEQVLINQFDRNLEHDGGAMFFGSDGFLYVSNGDEGRSDDYYGNAQKINKGLFSGVLRIDVNQDPTRSHPIRRQPLSGVTPPTNWLATYSSNYFIPNDNPFVNPDGSVLEEFFAIGFRSPHRMTFDPPTGQIWLGDVGDSAREEVDLIVKGGNYQWDYGEGLNFPGPTARPAVLTGIDMPPIYDYPHFDSNWNFTGSSCIIGGYVYRGSQFAGELAGKYVFGDNVSGRISALTYNGTNPPTVTYLCSMPGAGYDGLSSFGLDQNGELYMCQLGAHGKILKLARTGAAFAQPPPLLSQIGVFTNLATLSTSAGLIPYHVNSPLWSDGAVKSRWLAIPNDGAPNEQIGFAPAGEWTFPIGTVFVKHFELGIDDTNPGLRKRLETRVLVHATNGNYYGLTYKWRGDNSDADLLTNSLNEDIVIATSSGTRTQNWYYPSRQDCLICHNPNANFVLGVKTRQLNGPLTYPVSGITDNQLRTWNHLGLFTPALDETNIPGYAALVQVTNTTASLETRVRSYLDANCSQCHRPNGGVQANYDARFDTPLAAQGIINGPVGNTLGITGAKVITPSDISKSIMHVRLNTTGVNKMPPLARNTIDTDAVATLEAWIQSLIPLSITSQPQSQSVNPGESASLAVAVDGTGPFSYQWQHDARNIPGATNNVYAITNALPSDAGAYLVVVAGMSGSVISSNALVTVNGPPLITAEPQSQTVILGANLSLSVACSGTAPLSYQWQFDGTNIVDATASTYSLNNVQLTEAGSYSVFITNALGAATSSTATLNITIPAPTTWLDQAIGDVFLPGSVAYTNGTFTVNASGSDIWGDADAFHFVYQLMDGDASIVARVVSIDDTDPWAKAGVMIRETLDAGSSHAFMAITAENGANFQRRVTPGGTSDNTAGDSVNAPYWVRLVRSGDTFSGYSSSDGTNWVSVDDVDIAMTNMVYIGLAVTAHDNAVLNTSIFDNVQFIQSIAAQPQDKTVNQGADALFTVLVDGTPLSYQWRFNGTNISGATDSAYTVANAQPANAGAYSVIVTNLAGSVASSNASLTVNAPPSITTQPQSQAVIQGGNATFSVAATGMPPLGYQWQFNADAIAGATDATFTKTNAQPVDAGSYSVTVNSPSGSVTSSNALLVVNIPPAITLQPQDQILNLGSSASFSVAASGTAPLNYQWQFNSIPISGATDSSYILNQAQLTDVGSYSVQVTNSAGGVTSSPAALVLNVPPSVTTPPQSQSVNQGSDATFTVVASGTAPLSYQWLCNNNVIPGATSGSYTRANVQSADAGSYSVIVSNVAGSLTSSASTLSVNIPPSISSQPQSQFVTAGSNVTLSVVAAGTAPLGYQWMFGGTNIPGATSASYTRAAVQISDAGGYFVQVTNIAGSVTSSPASLTVGIPPSVTAPPQDQSVNQGSDATFTVIANGTSPLSFQWLYNNNIIPGATIGTYTRTNIQSADAGDYSVLITNVAGSVTSSVATLMVNIAPTITAQPQSQFVTAGSNVTFSVVAAGTAPLGYQWIFSGTNISGATSNSCTLAAVQASDAGNYSVQVTNIAGSVTSSPASLTVNIPPSVTAPPQNQSVNQGSDATFGVVVDGTAPLSYQWLVNNNIIPGATSGGYARTNVQSVDAGSYSVIVSNVAGIVTSSTATLTVNILPAITTQPQSQFVAAGSNVTFTVVAGGTAPLSYQWMLAGTNIPDATVSSYTRATVQTSDAGSYSVAITNIAGSVLSSAAVLTINTAPLLAPIADHIIKEGATLSITNFATDSDIPANMLVFSLDTNAPPGATINATNGIFTWTPTEAQGPGTNIIAVTVTDDGIPSLSDTKTFTVIVSEVNEPPVLAPIPDKIVHANTPVSLTTSATDPDLPANILTFSLDVSAAAGAQINPTNGVFTWNPGDSQLGTNLFTVRVVDDGTPILSDSRTFAVTVVARPTLQSLSVAGGNVSLSWSAIPGLTYRLQYKTSLTDGAWTDLPGDVTSIGNTASATDTSDLQTQRFYRIILVP
jgi:uncharacterized repeat protein (TIGR03806 family)